MLFMCVDGSIFGKMCGAAKKTLSRIKAGNEGMSTEF